MELRIETYERLPPVATGDTPVVTDGLRWVSSTGGDLAERNTDNDFPSSLYLGVKQQTLSPAFFFHLLTQLSNMELTCFRKNMKLTCRYDPCSVCQ